MNESMGETPPISAEEVSAFAEHSFMHLLGETDFNDSQTKAKEIIEELGLKPEQGRDLFIFHLWTQSASITLVKKITGLKDDAVIRSSLEQLWEDKDLIKSYDKFYLHYSKKSASNNSGTK